MDNCTRWYNFALFYVVARDVQDKCLALLVGGEFTQREGKGSHGAVMRCIRRVVLCASLEGTNVQHAVPFRWGKIQPNSVLFSHESRLVKF